jgi:hypothetical protein
MMDGLVEIPASLPQDEDMVDRLHLNAPSMSRVWCRIVHDARARGELFVINLHPERASLCAEPLNAALSAARQLGDIWIATLGEIADWWRERNAARVNVQGNGRQWSLTVDAPAAAVTTCAGRSITGSGSLTVDGPSKPIIRCGQTWPDGVRQRLRDAGYVTTADGDSSGYALDLDRALPVDTQADMVVRFVREHDQNLVRIQPWPDGYRSCLSVTSDLDALTLIDFAMRLKEF